MTPTMKVLSLFLIGFLKHSACFHVVSVASPDQYQPYFVCATFPFCYQENQAGVWKSVAGTSNLASSRDVAVESSECWLKGFYCRSDASNTIKTIPSETAEDCQVKCEEEDGCENFSFHRTRGQGGCALLSECLVKTECTEESNCIIGSATCDCPALEYLPGSKESTEYARWECGDIDPYSSATPVGTTCFATCASWEDSPLQSTCLRNGKWSSTKASSDSQRTLGYSAPYPTPDQPDMVCGCEAVGPFTYDPNTEAGAEFVCQGWEADRYSAEGGWTIKNNDICELFCSNEPQPIVSAYCEGATWKGEPELGFWCYDKPENPGPLPPKAVPKDKGYPRCDAGYYDVQGLGEALDYCRWVGNGGCRTEPSYWSCTLAGKTEDYSPKGAYTAP